MDQVRVLRILEYVGPREDIEDIIKNSIQGEKTFNRRVGGEPVTIRAATIGTYPEILETMDDGVDDDRPF